MIDDRLPVIVATGQVLEREEFVSPVELMARAGDLAFDQAPRLRARVQHVSMVKPLSDVGPTPASELSERLGIDPEVAETTTMGGNTPQWLVSKLADAIWSGELEVGLIAGGEAQRSIKAASGVARKRGTWHIASSDTPGTPGTATAGTAAPGTATAGTAAAGTAAAGTAAAGTAAAGTAAAGTAAAGTAAAGTAAAGTAAAGTEGPGAEGPGTEIGDAVIGDDRLGFGDAEAAAGLFVPVHVYPLFESVITHRAGRSFEDQRRFLGEMLAPLTEIASHHRCAWFPTARTPAEISEVSDENRLVSEPYSKRMCAFLGVDQAATVLMCSYGAAKAAGVSNSAIFCLSGADSEEVWFPAARPDLGRLPGLRSAGRAALEAAVLGIDEVELLDFYSCFPCVLQMAHEAFGVAVDDPRHSSVTGGLPYFGGPGNSYTLHSIATTAELLRAGGRAATGLVTGMGWYATKHAVGVYGTSPSAHGWRRGETAEYQSRIAASALPIALDIKEPGELARVEASTVHYSSTGQVTDAPLIATLDDGRRLAARAAESVTLSELRGRNLVGESVHVSGSPIRYRFT